MQKEAILKVIEEWMEGTTFFMVDITINRNNEIYVEFESETDNVDIDDCASLSQFIESRFDRVAEDYALEVSSAGLGQPFKVLKQYIKNIGNEVEVLPKTGKKFSGILKSADAGTFSLEMARKVKPEGAKRPVVVTETVTFTYDEVANVHSIVPFS